MQDHVFDQIADAFPMIGKMLVDFDAGLSAIVIQAAVFFRGISTFSQMQYNMGAG